jgi:hypothetical protein
MAPTSKISRKQEEKPKKPKTVANVWDSPFGKMLLDPDSSVESTTSGIFFRLRVRVPFSVFQMIVGTLYPGKQFNVFYELGGLVRLAGLYLLCDR